MAIAFWGSAVGGGVIFGEDTRGFRPKYRPMVLSVDVFYTDSMLQYVCKMFHCMLQSGPLCLAQPHGGKDRAGVREG